MFIVLVFNFSVVLKFFKISWGNEKNISYTLINIKTNICVKAMKYGNKCGKKERTGST